MDDSVGQGCCPRAWIQLLSKDLPVGRLLIGFNLTASAEKGVNQQGFTARNHMHRTMPGIVGAILISPLWDD